MEPGEEPCFQLPRHLRVGWPALTLLAGPGAQRWPARAGCEVAAGRGCCNSLAGHAPFAKCLARSAAPLDSAAAGRRDAKSQHAHRRSAGGTAGGVRRLAGSGGRLPVHWKRCRRPPVPCPAGSPARSHQRTHAQIINPTLYSAAGGPWQRRGGRGEADGLARAARGGRRAPRSRRALLPPPLPGRPGGLRLAPARYAGAAVGGRSGVGQPYCRRCTPGCPPRR